MTVLTEQVVTTNQSLAAQKLKSLSPRCRRELPVEKLARALHQYQAGDLEAAANWARVDLFNAFLGEDPTVPESDKAAKRLTLSETVLQVGVFVPILITWLGLAVAAFTASPGQSMLQSWEYSRFLPLRWVAVTTTALVLVLIFQTWRVFQRRAAAEAEEDKLRQDLSEALTLAELELAPLRQGVTEQVALRMGEVAQSLTNTATRFEGAGRTASRVQETATAAIGALAPVLETVNTAIQASRQATAELGAAPQKLMDPLDRLASATWEIGSATSESSRLFARAMADASAEIAAATSATSGVVAQALAAPLAALTSATASIADATSASSGEIAASSSASSARIAASLDNQAAEIRAAVDEAVAAAGGYASRTEIAADVLSRRMADMPDAVRSLHESLATVDRQLSELMRALAVVQADTTQVLKSAPDQLAESVRALGGAAATVTQAEKALASAATDIGGYASRAELTADALGKTHQALAEMPFAVRGLHEGVTGLGGQFTDLAKAVADAREAAGLMLRAASVLRDQAQAQEPEPGHRTGGLFSRSRS